MAAPGAADSVIVGRISGVWGVHGWVKVFSFTDPPAAIFEYQPWQLGPGERRIEVLEWRRQGKRLVAQLSGVNSPEQAAALLELDIRVDRSCLPTLAGRQYYWSDLIGLDVVNLEDHYYGKVTGLLATGANDVLDVANPDGAQVLIPFVLDRHVIEVDLTAARIRVDWPLAWERPDDA